jgi:hypothetical protein
MRVRSFLESKVSGSCTSMSISGTARKEVYIFSFVEDECALQGLSVLGSMCVSHNIRKQFSQVINVWNMDDCLEVQPCEGQ